MGKIEIDSNALEGAIDADPVASAKIAGLRYVNDADRGIARKRAGESFRYVDKDGKPIRDPKVLRRIASLVIPPAWTDVWICPHANGHLQATGRDARGRKQYRYHPGWRQVRDSTKYHRMLMFGEALPGIRRRCHEDAALPGLPREKVLASVVQLLELTLIRIGNEEYARDNGSFGLTTMRNRHVDVLGSHVHFHFRGKSGVKHDIDISDRRLARIVQRCRDLPGQALFQYQDSDGATHTIGSGDVNDYLRSIGGNDFTAKDFRTWAGTVHAATALRRLGPGETQAEAKKHINEAILETSGHLGNTPAVCRKCYVHPAVLESYLDGDLPPLDDARAASAADPHALTSAERSVLELLERSMRNTA